MNKLILILSLTLTFPLYADLCLNRAINKWCHGSNYDNLITSEIHIFPGISWEKVSPLNPEQRLKRLIKGIKKAYSNSFECEEDGIKETDIQGFIDGKILKNYRPFNKRSINKKNTLLAVCDDQKQYIKLQDYIAPNQDEIGSRQALDSDTTSLPELLKEKRFNLKEVSHRMKCILEKMSQTMQAIEHPKITHIRVGQQYGNSCGTHAVSNAWCLLNNDTEGLLVSDIKNDPASPFVKKQIPNLANLITVDLDGQAIDRIAQKLGLSKKQYTIIPDIEKINSESFDIKDFAASFNGFSDQDDDQFKGLCAFLRTIKKKQAVKHAFIVGDMNNNKTYGHWVAIVVESDGKGNITFKCADSYYDKVAEATQRGLIKLLRLDSCQLHMDRKLANLVPDAEKYSLMIDPVEPTLNNFKDIMSMAKEHSYEEKRYFHQEYLARMLAILNGMLHLGNSYTPLESDHIAMIKAICDDIGMIEHPDNPIRKTKDFFPELNNLLYPNSENSEVSPESSRSDITLSTDSSGSSDSIEEQSSESTGSIDDQIDE
ncbi:MAG: hypothetical protein M1114_01805 [Candidatus Dependentiae bacterium]|nr:hypothetical protein [Candidatus Dependentiae bacterium]